MELSFEEIESLQCQTNNMMTYIEPSLVKSNAHWPIRTLGNKARGQNHEKKLESNISPDRNFAKAYLKIILDFF